MNVMNDSEIEEIIESAVEYYKSHPDKINTFLNKEYANVDPVDVHIMDEVKNRLVVYMKEKE